MTAALSPRTAPGSFVWSLGAHLTVAGAVLLAMNWAGTKAAPVEEYMDFAYQTFDAPPVPATEEKRVVKSPQPVTQAKAETLPDSPRELQDANGEVAGTQKTSAENNIGSESNGGANATPYYRIKPKYPPSALIEGLEGWVMLQIDISETGEVENIRVVDGEQRNTFQAEAKRAVAQWKYKPFTDGTGKPTRRVDHMVRVDFKLEDANQTATN